MLLHIPNPKENKNDILETIFPPLTLKKKKEEKVSLKTYFITITFNRVFTKILSKGFKNLIFFFLQKFQKSSELGFSPTNPSRSSISESLFQFRQISTL